MYSLPFCCSLNGHFRFKNVHFRFIFYTVILLLKNNEPKVKHFSNRKRYNFNLKKKIKSLYFFLAKTAHLRISTYLKKQDKTSCVYVFESDRSTKTFTHNS